MARIEPRLEGDSGEYRGRWQTPPTTGGGVGGGVGHRTDRPRGSLQTRRINSWVNLPPLPLSALPSVLQS